MSIMKFKSSKRNHSLTVELGPKETLVPLPPPNVFTMKKILVPTDFSESSKKSFNYAAAFAEQFKAAILLLHVVEPYPTLPEAPLMYLDDLQKLAVKQAENHLKSLVESLSPRVPVEILVEVGQNWSTIADVARERAVDLVILSTHGRTGLAHVVLGSVAEKITRHAPCPVLVVRNHEKDFVVDAASQIEVEEGIDLPRARVGA